MRKLLIAASAAALLGGVSLAYAGDATGSIKSIDVASGTVTLDNGQTYTLSSDLKTAAANWKVGDKVTVTFTDGTMNATAVAPAS